MTMPTYDDDTKKIRFWATRTVPDPEFGGLKSVFTARVGEKHPKAIARKYEDKEGVEKKVYEEHHVSIGGLLLSVEMKKRKTKDGKTYFVWQIHLDGGDSVYSFSVNLQSPSSNSVMHRIPNCDLKKEIKFSTFYFSDKERTFITLTQKDADGKWVKIEKYWKFDDVEKIMTNGMPGLVVTEDLVTHAKEYNNKEQNLFMWTHFQKVILPVLSVNFVEFQNKKAVPEPAPEPETEHEDVTDAEVVEERPEEAPLPEEEDDLPF